VLPRLSVGVTAVQFRKQSSARRISERLNAGQVKRVLAVIGLEIGVGSGSHEYRSQCYFAVADCVVERGPGEVVAVHVVWS
jgi:hypothetical protein